MQFVLFHLLRVDGLKGSKAHMEGDLRDLNSTPANSCQYFGRKVQPRSWRGNAASRLRSGINSLVALAVLGPVRTRDIRWRRHMPELFHQSKEIWYRIKAQEIGRASCRERV